MARPSNRIMRREQILNAFTRVLAAHGYAGATIQTIAAEADLAPGLLHYHFKNKEELLTSLTTYLVKGFRMRSEKQEKNTDKMFNYIDAALALNEKSDTVIARCWVGLFAQALASPSLFKQFRRLMDREILHIQDLSERRLSNQDAASILAFMIGALVLGAFAPRKTAGFAAPALRRMIRGSS